MQIPSSVVADTVGFAQAKAVVELYIGSAKTYVQLSTGTLALSAAFADKVLGEKSAMTVTKMLLASWVCFVVAIGTGALYQYVVVTDLSQRSVIPNRSPWLPAYCSEAPGHIFGIMVIAFYLGAVLFAVASSTRLVNKLPIGP